MQDYMQEPRRTALASRVLALIAITLSSLLPASPQTAGASPMPISISYSLVMPRLTLHQPVIVTFKVSNASSQTIGLDLGQDRKGGFSFTITPPDGVRLKLSMPAREGASRIGRLSIAPGDSYSQNLVLNEWYDFSITGKYKVEGHLTEPIVIGNGQGYQSDPGLYASIEIGPRNELSLSKTCDSLANQIEASDSYAQAIDSAVALSYVNDPIAVAYLRRALSAHKLVEPIVIVGLERIGNAEAVQALADGLRADPSDTVRFRSALQRIQKQTDDAQIHEAINRILNPQ